MIELRSVLRVNKYMLVKKGSMKLKKNKSKMNVRINEPDPDQAKAIIELGFKDHPELQIQNPFIERQKQLVEDQKLNHHF
mmetsp:Transcript_8301/g.7352  ORF Transcript_8301/g.7352 Transcript_8301/m.7352 type:complete len:80 (-) Transcript_8301:600-839(-)